MSSSRILTTLALFQKPKKTRWPDPEKSIGEVCGTKKGKYNCWEAQGPAREVFEQIKPQIKELLSTAGSEVRRGELLLINIFMIGETQATALPHIMFSCRHRESRKTARTAIEKSGILDQCPPGMHLGDWDCPPHLENLRPLASSTSYTSFDDMADFINPPTEDRIGSSFYDYDIFPVLDPHKTRTIQALQLRIRNSPMMPEYLRTATIGAMVQLSDKRFYLAPAHIFPEQCSFTQNIASEDTDQYSEDSDCDFGGFESGDESLSDEQETEFMSQYSATPESSDLEDNWELDGADSSSTTDSDDFSSLEVIERAPDTTGSLDEGDSIPDEVNVHTSHHSVHQDIDSVTNSDNLDYCLIEVGENDYSSSHLPVLSRANIGGLDFEAVHVWAVTGSGCILTGILSSQRSCIRLPKATRFADVLSVKFEHSLQPGDSGSIVRDASTGMIYGHIIAGDIESQTAFIIPVVDVLDDLAVHYKNIEVLSIHNSLQSQSPFLTLRPRVAHYYKLGEMMEPSRELDMAITSPSLARRPSWHTVTPRERHLLTKQAWGAKRACRRTLYPSNCQRDPMLDTLCFEMEDARLQEHFSSLFSSLIIRGLSDYADSLYSREDSEDVRKEHHGIDSLGSGRQYELIKPQSILKRSNLSADIAKYALFGFGNDGKSRIAFEWIMWNLLPETDQRHTDPSEDRSESLQKIAKWVASPKEVFCLHGMGCVGKSILAHTFARNSMLGDSLFIFKRSEQTFPSSEIPLFDHIFTDYLSRIIQQHPLAIFGPSVASQMTALWTLSEPVDRSWLNLIAPSGLI
ncbi:hypothetical protein BDW59DRAFT_160046 [Aspergillus cavernicola]|uniref:Uncharacterized protein n=1 Tax=Aspergillus cavernicola TaxID=176166 RepID=A0ABR4IJ04_9EURO